MWGEGGESFNALHLIFFAEELEYIAPVDVLAGRKTVGETSGSILFSGVKPTQTFLRRFTGYTPAAALHPLS